MNEHLNGYWAKDSQQREQLARQFTPLVYKIANQQRDKTALSYSDVVGFGFEGLAVAMNSYDPSKGQTFAQYAGYRILYAIQNGSNNEGHTVKFSSYMQGKRKESGESTWIMRSLDIYTDDEGETHCSIKEPSVDAEDAFIPSIFDDLYEKLESKFTTRDCEVFYQTYGLKEYDITKGTVLAKKYGCSGTNITFINQKIIEYIRTDQDLMDELSALL